MRSLSVQVQPGRASGIGMVELRAAFLGLVNRIDLVRHHHFDDGHDDGVAYFNFTFSTERPRELWLAMRRSIFEDVRFEAHLATASMAMCSGEHGWDDYVQLQHWNSAVPTVSADDL